MPEAIVFALILLLVTATDPICFAGQPSAHSIGEVLDPASPRAKLLSELHLHTTACPDVLRALTVGKYDVVVADATPAALRTLVAHPGAVQMFAARGGWLLLWRLTPQGLADFNRLVGVDHLIRPFTVEAVSLPRNPDALLSGADPYDLLMFKGKGILDIPLRAGDAWSYVLDGDDIAPFAAIPPSSYWRPGSVSAPGSDQHPANLVNGMDDSWQLGFTFPIDRPEALHWTFAFPRTETVTRFSLTPDTLYRQITRIRLSFTGSAAGPLEFDVAPGELVRQDFHVPNVTATGVTLQILTMTDNPVGVAGIRNVCINVKRSDEFRKKVVPLLSIGVLNKYPLGKGGIIVNEMQVENDQSAANHHKQKSLLGTLLGNLLHKPAAPAPISTPDAGAKMTDGDTTNVDAFVHADDLDDTQAIRRAIYYALDHKLSRVIFGPRAYFSNSPIQIQGANTLILQGALTASGKPVTTLVFLVPSRFSTPTPTYENPVISGVSTRNFVFLFSGYW